MLDIKLIRKDPKQTEKLLQTKDPHIVLSPILTLDEKIRKLKNHIELLKNQKNQNAKEVGKKKRQGEDVSSLLNEITGIGEGIEAKEKELKEVQKNFETLISYLPNLPMKEVKPSLDPKENICLKTIGEKPSFDFTPKNHLELNETLHLFDFKRGAKITGAGWPIYRGLGARLEWALIQLMIDVHLANGFELWIPPLLARSETMLGVAQLPKFEKQLYRLDEKNHNLFLIPTSEAVLNGLHGDEILDEKNLPLRYTAYTPCFRREAGAAGSQERGLIRTHQFNKVELFCLTTPEQSLSIYDEMLKSAETVLKKLNLHYRHMLLVTGDISFASAKTIDLEVWLPGQECYYEVSSISNCTDFQARRSKIRYKKSKGKPSYVYTLNGSGLATSRLMVALLESYQQKDGTITLPPALHSYMKGIQSITP